VTTDNTTETPDGSTEFNPHLRYLLERLQPFLAMDATAEELARESGRHMLAFAAGLKGADPAVGASLADQARAWLSATVAAGTVPMVRAELLATGLDIAFHMTAAVREAFPPDTDDSLTSNYKD
jgi:hypothetical protein